MLRPFLTLSLAFFLLSCSSSVTYDTVIANGRVMDPESGLDAALHVGIKDGKVAILSKNEIDGKNVLDASDHVVTAGFIDLHRHGHSPENYRAQIHDGITSTLELEIGVEDITSFYSEREGTSILNYGAAISHAYSRNIIMTGSNPGLEGEALLQPLTGNQLKALEQHITDALNRGAVAVGFGLAYSPGATSTELLTIFELAKKFEANCHVHIRTSRTDASNVDEVLQYSKQSGAALHIVHINSSGAKLIPLYLETIAKARQAGIDVTTEAYPYNRGSTFIESHLFDDWETYSDEKIGQHIFVETGENLNRKSFAHYREKGGLLITQPAYSMEMVSTAIASPLTMIASDGMWLDKGRAHPRTFGTYARILGRYVREQQALSLMDALSKMSLQPARRLERRVPEMRNKGCVRVGADADLVVFNPETVIDTGTFENPAQHPEGIRHVLVNGAAVLIESEIVKGVFPGRAIRGAIKENGTAP
ncbi:MAG: D-glutamate deacylase [Solibacterales bacterium]|nr:D-glutamate deacylase [Bryobacterales bacterium]|tara:strand:- start:97671 stop:99107 length:1437 start_codon:yes stop_codon:yes gene_type:complete